MQILAAFCILLQFSNTKLTVKINARVILVVEVSLILPENLCLSSIETYFPLTPLSTSLQNSKVIFVFL